MGCCLKRFIVSFAWPWLASSSNPAQDQQDLLPEAALAHWLLLPFILLAPDLSTKCNSAKLILVLYCLTCKYHVDTYGCLLAFISHAICPSPVSATQPLLPDCLYAPLEWHVSTYFIIKENSFHKWLSNSKGLCQLEVTINCWAVTHFIVGYHLSLFQMKWQLEEIGRDTLLSSLWERFKKKKERGRDTFMNHASCLLPCQGNYLLYTTHQYHWPLS